MRDKVLEILVSDDPVDGGHRWDVVFSADVILNELLSDLPSKHGRVGSLISSDTLDNSWSGNFRFGSADDSWSDRSCRVEATENFRHTTMGDFQLSGDITWPSATL